MNLCVCLYPFPKNLPMKRVLVVDNYDSFVYNLVQILHEEPTCSFEVVTNDHIPFDRLNEFDCLLLSPGPGVPEEAGDLLPLIDRCYQSHAMLGVCLGHQAIAEVFGATLVNLTHVHHGVQSPLVLEDDGHATLPIPIEKDRLFRHVPHGTPVGRYHSWVVSSEGFPRCLAVTALSPEGHIMALKHRTLDVHGIQFHPESVLTPEGRKIMENFLFNED